MPHRFCSKQQKCKNISNSKRIKAIIFFKTNTTKPCYEQSQKHTHQNVNANITHTIGTDILWKWWNYVDFHSLFGNLQQLCVTTTKMWTKNKQPTHKRHTHTHPPVRCVCIGYGIWCCTLLALLLIFCRLMFCHDKTKLNILLNRITFHLRRFHVIIQYMHTSFPAEKKEYAWQLPAPK